MRKWELHAVLQAENVLAHCARIADETVCPQQDAFAFRRETLKARGALHERCIERLLETLDAKRESRLGNSATFRGTSEMLLA